eukprot:m.83622 g.83622  ORF g.83622 m.83622 type:complete len:561 (+) comp12725_c0_seq2:501-2183(+)
MTGGGSMSVTGERRERIPQGLEGDQRLLKRSPFTNAFAGGIYEVTWLFLAPSYYAWQALVSLTRPTTDEHRNAVWTVILFTLWSLAFIVSIPFFVIGIPFNLLSQLKRRSFTYRVYPEPVRRPVFKREWTVVSANTALFPEGRARKFNVRHNDDRARDIGVRFASAAAVTRAQRPPASTDHLLQDMVAADFVCLFQVHDPASAHRLRYQMRNHFPFMISDEGVLLMRRGRLCIGSGIMLASKYPIMDAEFIPFPGPFDNHIARGMLAAKLHLIKPHKDDMSRRTVGYIIMTELSKHAGERTQQLEYLDMHGRDFRERTLDRRTEVVGFHILTGDFKFDNVSADDKPFWSHTMFERYKDPFKERPGVDKPWSRPTHLNPKVLRDKRFVTPSALANALTNNWQEVAYMPSLLEECCVDGVGRSQYCLLKHHISDQFPSTIKTSAVITALAGITTHLPITVVFRVGDDNDNMPHFVATSTQQQSKGHFFVPSSQYQPIEVEPATPKQKDPHKHLSQRQTNVGVVAVGTEQTMPVIIADLDSDEETDSDDQDEASTTFLDISEV